MKNKKILIIDYDTRILSSLSDFLQNKGFSVLTAVDGESGLETYLTENPDLIIMEPMLPKIHGFDLCAKIMEKADNGVPIIIGTGIYKENQVNREALHFLEKSAFIKKPYTNDEIFSLIHTLLTPSSKENPEKDQERNLPSENSRVTSQTTELPQDRTNANIEEKIKEQIYTAIQSTEVHPSTKEKKTEIKEDIDIMLKDTLSEFGLNKKKETSREKKEFQKKEEAQDKAKSEPVLSSQEKKEEKKIPDEIAVKTQDFLFGEFQKKKIKLVPILIISAAVLIAVIVTYAVFFRSPSLPNTLQASEAQLSGSIFQQVNDSSEIGENTISPRTYSEETVENTLLSQSEKEETTEEPLLGDNLNPTGESSRDSALTEEPSSTQSAEVLSGSTPKKEPTIEYEDPEIAPPSILPEIQKALQSDVRNSATEETYATKAVQENPPPDNSIAANLPAGETNPPKETAKMGDLVPLTQVDAEPEPIKTVQPKYPPSAMAFNVQGQLVVNVLISENGDVLKTVILREIKNSKGLNESGEKAIQQWKFKPAMKDGVPVKVWKPISIAFKKRK